MKLDNGDIEVVLTEEELDELIKDYTWPRNTAQLLHECCEKDK